MAESSEVIVIVGIGGHGRETLDIIEAINQDERLFEFLGFLDDNAGDDSAARRNISVLGPVGSLVEIDAAYVIGIGSPAARRRIDSLATGAGRMATRLIHPAASMGSDVELGPGAILAAGARITTNVRAGRHFHLNVGATVAHDCTIGDYVSLSPGAHLSGNVTLGDEVFLGTGAVVIPGCTIGHEAVVGAGAVVVEDVPAGTTVGGVPARSFGKARS